ncbi:uncharacterized protein RHIMIDRAFT_315575 [Rhizopus microsporus ATCC 52813]|uniref:chitin synthase n=1 Tax=Rhizopus microsporus ATCC 52813 TaxID=1340429 RepID=A0A2G4SKR4_RHIZD|nr:uncharacterized protein RHIMIDRAFT_315575 [Rhizopus microsporus ATCC 52813]PHZ09332.1 hypothetical protein RHIMIDRAFT_315575 [Rhizopus microsporus ATCC 52813]
MVDHCSHQDQTQVNINQILQQLEARYNADQPYMNLGSHRLVVLNPHKPLDLLNDATLEVYGQHGYKNISCQQPQDEQRLEPHIYELATKVYFLLRRRNEDQAIMLSGLSGSGKSTTHHHLLKELLYLSTHTKRDEKIRNQILGANTILKSFLTAASSHDTSCSNIFQTLQFNKRGHIAGLSNSIFLLDKHRLTRAHLSNFTVFYQLLAGSTADEKQALHITHTTFNYLKPSNQQRQQMDDIAFQDLKFALKQCGFKTKIVAQLCQLLAAILHLGNIQFVDKRHYRLSEKDFGNGLESSQGSCRIKNKETLALVAAALGVTVSRLENTLTHQSKLIGNEFCTAFLTVDLANQQRDNLAQTLYTTLVYWIVTTMNQRLARAEDNTIRTISILDTMSLNSSGDFHSLCSNYVLEQLQQHMLELSFEQEHVEPRPTTILFHGSSGLFACLNNESRRMESYALDATDSNFLSLLFQRKKSSTDYRALLDPSTPSYSFAIKHFESYATDYSIDSFLENNLDTISPDFVHLLKNSCTNMFVAELFNINTSYWITETHPRDSSTIIKAQLPLWPPEPAESRESNRLDNEDQPASKQPNSSSKKGTQTVLDQVSKGLDYLKRKLAPMQVFEVIHIQPNAQQKPNLFEDDHVVHQLNCYKIVTLMNHASDAVYSYTYEQMCERYGPLIDQDGANEDKAIISEWAKSRQYTEREVKLKADSVELSFSVWKSLENQLRTLEKEVSLREKERQATLEAEKERARYAAMIAATEAEEATLQETTESAAQNIDAPNAAMSIDPWSNECNPFADDYKSEFTAEDDQTFIDYQLNSFEDRKSDWYEEEQEEKVLSEGYGPNLDMSEMMKDNNVQPEEQIEEVTITNIRIWWTRFVYFSTWWIPSSALKYIGRMPREDVQMAWREKVTLCILIFFFSAGVIFCIVGLGIIICPEAKDLYTAQDVLNHQSMNDYWISIRGKVYEVTKFVAEDHGSPLAMTTSSSLESLAGRDLSYTFPPPLTVACPGLVEDNSIVVTPNESIVLGPFVHFSGAQQPDKTLKNLRNPDWLTKQFEPIMTPYKKGDLVISMKQMKNDFKSWGRLIAAIDERVYDLTDYMATARRFQTPGINNYHYLHPSVENLFVQFGGSDITEEWKHHTTSMDDTTRARNLACLNNAFYVGRLDFRDSARCTFANYLLLSFALVLSVVIVIKFLAALQFGGTPTPEDHDKFVICQVPCYTEDEESLRKTINSLTAMTYDDKHKLLFLIADGMIIGSGNDRPTPRILLDILEHDEDDEPEAFMFKSIGEGSKQLNYGKVYSGVYQHEGHVVPYVVVVKVGKPTERTKPGNRGKRDSQIICMNFLSKVHFDAEMSPLELEIYYHIKHIIGIDPSLYEYILMVDSDTEVYPDALNRLVSCMLHDSRVIGLCGETELGNQDRSWITMIQVYEYYISHHLVKSFESIFGSVTCLPGCFSNKHIPLIVSPNVIQAYSDNRVDTLHKKNLLHLGEDRYLTTLMMKNFPEYKMMFTPYAKCRTVAPDEWRVLLSQRRRWINSTIHNLLELVMLPELCGFCCLSMRFVVMTDLIGTITLPSSVIYLIYLIYTVVSGAGPIPTIALVTLVGAYGLQSLIFLFKRQWQHIGWMIIYILAIPIFSFFIPVYAFWHFDDFSWGNTRVVVGDNKKKQIIVTDDEKFDEKMIPMKKWSQYEKEMQEAAMLEQDALSGYSSYGRCSCDDYKGENDSLSYRSQYICRYHQEAYEKPVHNYYSTDYNHSFNNLSVHTSQLLPESLPNVEPMGELSLEFSSVLKPVMSPNQEQQIDEKGKPKYVMLPEDDEIEKEIYTILTTSDLMTLTKKQVRDKLSEIFGIDLTIKKDFINSVIERLLESDDILNALQSL